MANVIDRLRVNGNPAPRNLPSQPESGLKRVGGGRERGDAPHGTPTPIQFVLNHSQLQSRDSSGNRNINQAVRRLEHLQRIQLANQGLSSMDARQPDLSGKQFMLRGKPASADTLLHRQHQLQQLQQQHQLQQEWCGASASSGKVSAAHAALTRSMSQKVVGENLNGVLHPTRSELCRGEGASTTTTNINGPGVTSSGTTFIPSQPLPSSLRPPHSASAASSYFLLANPHPLHPQQNSRSAQPGNSSSRRNRNLAEGRAAEQGFSGVESSGGGAKAARRQSKRLNSGGSAASFELTGRQDRRSPGLKDATTEQPPVDPQSLRQCLHVQQSTHPDSTTEVHKHLAQFTRTEAKINYNNPYRQTRSKERRTLPESERRYIFDSVASYIHFNKIYPNNDSLGGAGGSPNKSAPQRSGFQGLAIKEGTPRVPHMTGFPKHCTDTILLRMMFELNKPGAIHGIGLGHQAAGAPSMKSTESTTKYSDIGQHQDLDELTIQGDTPSLSSHRQLHLQQQQQQPNSHHTTGDDSRPSSTTASSKKEERKGKKEGEANGHRIAEEEEEEDNSTLITATTPGRRAEPDDDDDAEDADDEASAEPCPTSSTAQSAANEVCICDHVVCVLCVDGSVIRKVQFFERIQADGSEQGEVDC
ncbi:hypothetical protein ACOMHN_044081 [Nucella lapillus]